MHHTSQALEVYLAHLRGLPFVNRVNVLDQGANPRGEITLELSLADRSRRRLFVDVRSSHLPKNAATLWAFERAHEDEDWILAAPHVGSVLGDDFEARGLNFIDRQGNVYLRFGDRFVARVQGRRAPKSPATSKEMRAAGYQVMFALLAQPELVQAPQREIAEAAGTSRQAVIHVLARLEEEGRLVRRARRHAWANAPDASLLERWLEGYRSRLRPRLLVGRYRLPVRTPPEVEAWLERKLGVVRYGGTAGAHRLVGHYRGPLTAAHLGPASEPLRLQLEAVAHPEGELIWLGDMGPLSLEGETADTLHPLFLYAELVCDPDPRSAEIAAHLREARLPWSR